MIIHSSPASSTLEALHLSGKHVTVPVGKLADHADGASGIVRADNSSQSLWAILFTRERAAIAFDVLVWIFVVFVIACAVYKCRVHKLKSRKLSRTNSIYRKESRHGHAPPSVTLDLISNQV